MKAKFTHKSVGDPVTIYVLQLQHNCYYIGKSMNDSTVQSRIQSHKDGKGCLWTKIHKFVSVQEIIPNCDIFDEDKITKAYMSQFGIDNVRGGAYVQEFLTKNQREILNREIRNATGRCMICGCNEHKAEDCVNQIAIVDEEADIDDNFEFKDNICDKCTRFFSTKYELEFHKAFNCEYENLEPPPKSEYSTSTAQFTNESPVPILPNKESLETNLCEMWNKCGTNGNAENNYTGMRHVVQDFKCFRCGQPGHFARDCTLTANVIDDEKETMDIEIDKQKKQISTKQSIKNETIHQQFQNNANFRQTNL